MIDKRAIIEAARREIADELATMTRLARDAAEAATHEENKPENDKDMRSTEASYLARGQAERARDLERAHAMLGAMQLRDFDEGASIETSALVTLKHRGNETRCLLVAAGGGRRVKVEDGEVQLVTPTSPLGEALVSLTVGDEAEVPTPQGTKTYEIVAVR